MTTDTLAYVAGILDSEGSVYLGTSPFGPVVSLAMPLHASAVLTLARDLLGGTIWTLPKKSPFTWLQWELEGVSAADALDQMLPHLHTKLPQAQLAAKVGRYPLPTPTDQRTYLARMRALNAQEEAMPSVPLPGTRLLALRAGEHLVLPQRDLFNTTGWERLSGSFPESAIVERWSIWTANTSDWRSEEDGCSVCSLASILEPAVAPKYYLSPKACAGILRRAAKRGKDIPPALEAALKAVAAKLPPDEVMEDEDESPEDSKEMTAEPTKTMPLTVG